MVALMLEPIASACATERPLRRIIAPIASNAWVAATHSRSLPASVTRRFAIASSCGAESCVDSTAFGSWADAAMRTAGDSVESASM